ncbi:DUF4010 domain-containing protein [Candidatus Falkowbacteria bacterium]|nr:DUF4010 domain-containing protein [Candidatus Falkowbacteria bacterium]
MYMFLSLPLKFLIAIALGAVIGLERQAHHQEEKDAESKRLQKFDLGSPGGLRTFAIVAAIGAIVGLLSINSYCYIGAIIASAVIILLCSYYIIDGWLTKSTGMTTELCVLYVFIIGFLVMTEILPIQVTIALTVVLLALLAFKEKFKLLAIGIKKSELQGFLSFAIIALVILPFLPNKSYFLTDIPGLSTIFGAYDINLGALAKLEILNPFKLWFIVALVTGIDVFGYILSKIFGQKSGIYLTSMLGGFVSSTSTTQSLAQQSKKNLKINTLVSAAIFANMTSFLQMFVLIAPLNGTWLVKITPTLLTILLAALLVGIFYLYLGKKKTIEKRAGAEIETKELKIFSLAPALKFALLLISIKAITKFCLAFFGTKGFLFSSVIASFSGMDAIIINLAEMVNKTITFQTALLTFLCVNATNLLSKTVYSFIQGKREFAWKLALAMLFIIATSFVGYLFL